MGGGLDLRDGESVMSEIDEFQHWYAAQRPDLPEPFEMVASGKRFVSMETEWAWRAWQAARAQGEPKGVVNFNGDVEWFGDSPSAGAEIYTHPPTSANQGGVPEPFMRLFKHARGLAFGQDWNKGTAQSYHRKPLIQAVDDCKLWLTTSPSKPEQEWVRCSDDMPKLGQRVKLFSQGVIQHYMPVLDEGDDGLFWDFEADHNPRVDFNRDQWMPIPQPPKEGKGDE